MPVQNQQRARDTQTFSASNQDTVVLRRATTVIIKGRPEGVESLRMPPRPKPEVDTKISSKEISQIGKKYTTSEFVAVTKEAETYRAKIHDWRLAQAFFNKGAWSQAWQQCCAWVSKRVGMAIKQGMPTQNFLNGSLSHTVEQLKSLYEKKVEPMLVNVRDDHGGRTFQRTKETPQVLVLASVPTARINTIINWETLSERVAAVAEAQRVNYVHPLKGIGTARVGLSRFNDKAAKETLEFAYRRPGKVDVIINGKKIGNVWNDDAVKIAEKFVQHKDIRLSKEKSVSYTVMKASERKVA